MTPDEQARAELIGLLSSYGEYVEVETAIQHVKDAWQRSQPVEITEEMVEAAADSMIQRLTWPSLHWPTVQLDGINHRDVARALARAALSAALGGEGRDHETHP